MTENHCTPHKTCTQCKQSKSVTSFSKNINHKDGLRSQCKDCDKVRKDAYRHTRDGLISVIFNSQIFSSKKRCHNNPNYTKEKLKIWVYQQPSFDALYLAWILSGYNQYKRPSVDRIKDSLPYTFCNIQLMTWGDNKNKGYSDRVKDIYNKRNKPVNKYDIRDNFIASYYSIREASDKNKTSQSCICSCCKGRSETAGGFKWRYA